jgi:hypothetical protein
MRQAYCNVTTFDWTQPLVRELWIDTVLNATAAGVDGIFADHSARESTSRAPHQTATARLQISKLDASLGKLR